MVEKVSVSCPKCRVRLRMPLGLRAGKKPKCPKCKTLVRPADVLPPELLAIPAVPKAKPEQPPVDALAETKPPQSDTASHEYQSSSEVAPARPASPPPPEKTIVAPPVPPAKSERPPVDLYAETKTRLPDGKSREADPYAETVTKLPDEIPSPAVSYDDPAAWMLPPMPEEEPSPEDSDDDPPPWAKPEPRSPKPPVPPVPAGLEETRIPLPGELPAGLEETRIPLDGEWPFGPKSPGKS